MNYDLYQIMNHLTIDEFKDKCKQIDTNNYSVLSTSSIISDNEPTTNLSTHSKSNPSTSSRSSTPTFDSSTLGDNTAWNERFQITLSLPETSSIEMLHKYTLLSHLSTDFLSIATQYGRIIISEYFLSEAQQTIKPMNVGGIQNKKYK
jgi:hypothetical protein